MNYKSHWLTVIFCVALMFGSSVALAESITATCYSPQGKRFDFISGNRQESEDGYSNSNPTFFFTTRDPEVLIESWQAALPFPELIARERVDQIVPPSVTKSVVVFRSKNVIQALLVEGSYSYTTTLYLETATAIFTRIRILATTGPDLGPMGAIYTAKCNFAVLE